MKNSNNTRFLFVGMIFLFLVGTGVAQENRSSTDILFFQKREVNTGYIFQFGKEREEVRTNNSRNFEQLTTGINKYKFEQRNWNFLNFKQEQWQYKLEGGPMWSGGDWIDSSFVENIEADDKIIGVRMNAAVDFASRFYYDSKKYTLVEVSVWVRYDLFQQKLNGTAIDSNGVLTDFSNKANRSKFRAGFQAKAGWGIGRLNPMNHYMIAEYFLRKYYPGRNFSEKEVRQLAHEIGNIKRQRSVKLERNLEKELRQLTDSLRAQLLLTPPEHLKAEWAQGEFVPRYNGKRMEAGPFFRYFNREPDFVYGGYIQLETDKYINVKWNRNFKASLNYNRYKKQDWLLAEFDFGYSFFLNLKSQLDFGLKYLPGVVVNGFENIEPLRHNFIPYLSFFTQLNSKKRVNLSFAYKITDSKQFIIPGPEFSIGIYWSKY